MADQGTKGTPIAAPVLGPNEGGYPVDGDTAPSGECHGGHLIPVTPGNNVKPR